MNQLAAFCGGCGEAEYVFNLERCIECDLYLCPDCGPICIECDRAKGHDY